MYDDGKAIGTSARAPRWRVWLHSPAFWIVVAAFAVRIGFMLAKRTYEFNLGGDDVAYLDETTSIARSIASGHGFSSPFSAAYTGPTAWIAPVYPYVCALAFAVFGVFSRGAAVALITLQCVFSAVTCVPMLRIADRTVGRRAGLVAICAWAVFPWFSKWAVTWVWEIALSTLLATCLVAYALRLPEAETRRPWILFGALCGLSLLVNPALLMFVPVALAWCAYERRKQSRSWLQRVMFSLIVCFVVISPWLVRNRTVMGHWVFLRDNFGYEFALGNYHGSVGRGWGGRHPFTNAAELQNYARLGEIAWVKSWSQTGSDFVRRYPDEFLTLTAKRVSYFWDGSASGYRQPIAAYWLPSSFVVLSFLMLPAMLVAQRRQFCGWPMFLGLLLLYPLPYYLTYSQVRYRHVVEPYMLLLLAYAAVQVAGRTPKSRSNHSEPSTQPATRHASMQR